MLLFFGWLSRVGSLQRTCSRSMVPIWMWLVCLVVKGGVYWSTIYSFCVVSISSQIWRFLCYRYNLPTGLMESLPCAWSPGWFSQLPLTKFGGILFIFITRLCSLWELQLILCMDEILPKVIVSFLDLVVFVLIFLALGPLLVFFSYLRF